MDSLTKARMVQVKVLLEVRGYMELASLAEAVGRDRKPFLRRARMITSKFLENKEYMDALVSYDASKATRSTFLNCCAPPTHPNCDCHLHKKKDNENV